MIVKPSLASLLYPAIFIVLGALFYPTIEPSNRIYLILLSVVGALLWLVPSLLRSWRVSITVDNQDLIYRGIFRSFKLSVPHMQSVRVQRMGYVQNMIITSTDNREAIYITDFSGRSISKLGEKLKTVNPQLNIVNITARTNIKNYTDGL